MLRLQWAVAAAILGGIDKCFAAEPIPDDVWQRMQASSGVVTGQPVRITSISRL